MRVEKCFIEERDMIVDVLSNLLLQDIYYVT